MGLKILKSCLLIFECVTNRVQREILPSLPLHPQRGCFRAISLCLKFQRRQPFCSVLLIFLFAFSLSAQVPVEGVLHWRGESPAYVSVYAKDSHQLIPLKKDGKFACRLPRFEECILIFYQKNSYPKSISINTDQAAASGIEIRLTLDQGEPEGGHNFRIGPVQRFAASGNRYQAKKFDLDNVSDKTLYGELMAKATTAIRRFYDEGIVPSQLMGVTSNMDVSSYRKSEHRLGQEIYMLLQKKRALENLLTNLRAKQKNTVALTVKDCDIDLTLLKKEASLARINFDLAAKEADREKIKVRKAEETGRQIPPDKVRETTLDMQQKRRFYEVASLNMKNKQADCWELRLQREIEDEINAGRSANDEVIKIKKLDINDIRMQQRLENAQQLRTHHNALAMDLTGRDRHVQLAYTQKYIAEIEQVRYFQADNNVKRWEHKDRKQNKYDRQIEQAKKRREELREIAWQADMGYHEHMWHLRERPDLEETDSEDIFEVQTGLLALHSFKRKKLEEETETIEDIADSNQVAGVEVEELNDTRGKVRKIKLKDDYYEIIEDQNGKRKYFKNGSPVTKLTYAFETKRQFGKLLENVKTEEEKNEKMNWLKDIFN